MPSANIQYRDSVFRCLFSTDKNYKKNFLSLYNALHNTDYKLEDTVIERKEIDQTLYHTFNNDVSMMVNGKLIVLLEHQSTINENMPYRFLEYVSRIYETMIPSDYRFRHARFQIPTPEFWVLYNGQANYPENKVLKLSDSFMNSGDINLELTVNVKNIGPGKNLSIINKCGILKEYCQFIELMNKNVVRGNRKSYDNAIKESIKQGILKDFLIEHSKEIINMIFAEYNYDDDIRVQRQEAAQQKAIEAARNLLKEMVPLAIISRCVGLSVDELEKLQKEVCLTN